MRGYTQKQLAEKAGIHEMSIQFYEYGTRRPKPEQLPKLAEALDVDVAYLQPTVMDSPLSLLALLFDFMDEFGDVKIEQHNGDILFGVGSEHDPENQLRHPRSMPMKPFLRKSLRSGCWTILIKNKNKCSHCKCGYSR